MHESTYIFKSREMLNDMVLYCCESARPPRKPLRRTRFCDHYLHVQYSSKFVQCQSFIHIKHPSTARIILLLPKPLTMYKLRAELRAHSTDVRGVAVSSSGEIATASRDNTVIIWDVESAEPRMVLRGHDHFVNDLAFVAGGKLVTASGDKTLRVWDMKSGECAGVLCGHEGAVCGVVGVGQGKVASASWDGTARIWQIESGKCLTVLKGHEGAVWGVDGIAEGGFVTVGADKTVRVWGVEGNGVALKTVHRDVVRGVLVGPKGGFVTVANDSMMVHWVNGGRGFVASSRIDDLHDGSYIYSVDGMEIAAEKWLFASGGEDASVRVVEADFGGEGRMQCMQTIMHPGTVWNVSLCPNGDIVSACSDGVARVFTKNPEAVADSDILANFDKAVSERQLNTRVIGGVDVNKLPEAKDALAEPGRKDGENKIVKTATGTAEVYMWSAADARWSKVGDVVDNPSGDTSGDRGIIKGKSYDFVFDVEIGEDGKKEKLGFNKGENPYFAAQRFIDDNELSQEFLDQIAQFIEQQVPADALRSQNAGPSDPLTGGSRYVPRGATQSGAAGADPLTGGSRYVPGGSAIPPGKLPPPRKLIPYKDGVILYKNSDQLEKIQLKLSEFNTAFAREGSHFTLSVEEAGVFAQSLMPKLHTRGGALVILDDADCAVVSKLLTWPTSHAFPVLDIARLVIAVPQGSSFFFGTHNGKILDDVLRHLSATDASAPVHIMGCRFLCNMFSNRVAGSKAQSDVGNILRATSRASKSANRRARETFASLMINYAVSLFESKASADDRVPFFKCIIDMVSTGEKDEEVVYRLMLALGTLLCGDVSCARKGVELGVARAASDAAPKSGRTQQVALEIATIIAN